MHLYKSDTGARCVSIIRDPPEVDSLHKINLFNAKFESNVFIDLYDTVDLVIVDTKYSVSGRFSIDGRCENYPSENGGWIYTGHAADIIVNEVDCEVRGVR